MILTIVLGVFGLGLMIFIHESGHYLAARIVGVHVEVFSLGWGRKLVGFTRGGTTYQVSWFPVGGYCKLKGDELLKQARAADEPPVAQERDSFYAGSPWRRIMIAVFGPLANVVFAILVFAVIWWAGFRVYSPDNRVVLATDYSLDQFTAPPPATVAGMHTGDRIVAVDGTTVRNFQDILEKVSESPGRAVHLRVERGIQTLDLAVTPELDRSTGAGRIGVYSWIDPVVGSVTSGRAAALAGLRPGDRILRAGDLPVTNAIDLQQALAAKPGSLAITYERGGAEHQAILVLEYGADGSANLGIDYAVPVWRSPRVGLPGAIVRSVQETWQTVVLTVRGIGLLFRGVNLRSAVAGPLRITYYIGSAAASGFTLGIGQGVLTFFRFLAFLSVVLFLMNLLPLPAMDGGQLVMFAVEVVRGRPVRPQLMWRVQVIGFTVLLALSIVVTFSDVLFFLGR